MIKLANLNMNSEEKEVESDYNAAPRIKSRIAMNKMENVVRK